MIPTPIPESESFLVSFGGVGNGVGIVVTGIGIVVIGIGSRNCGEWNRNRITIPIPHIYVYLVLVQEVNHSNTPLTAVSKSTHTKSETQLCETGYVCLG